MRDKCRIIVVNDNYKRIENADILFGYDGSWWRYHWQALELMEFAGERWTTDADAATALGLNYVEMRNRAAGLSTTPSAINSGGNSGYGAINLAYLFGARHILLVGYDMQKADGRTHWFGEHPSPLWNYHPDDMIASWATKFDQLAVDLLAHGTTVINCTINTALECFPRSTLERELS